MKTPMCIEVVRSSRKKLSSLSNVSALAIVKSLSEYYSNVSLTVVDTTDDLAALIERKPDLAFLGMMFVPDSADPSQKVWLGEQLEKAGIQHTGSTRASHELGLYKDRAKRQISNHGLATARFFVAPFNQPYVEPKEKLNFPLFVKPVSGGGGQGVDEYSIVRTPEQLRSKIASLRANHNASVLVEDYLEGREFSVAIIKDQTSDELTAMPIELIAPHDVNGEAMLSKRVKSLDLDKAIAVNNPQEHDLISSFAIDVFKALGARDYGRIDIRLDAKGTPHFLEANLIPSLINDYGSFPRAYKLNHGVKYDEMINNITLLGLARHKPKS